MTTRITTPGGRIMYFNSEVLDLVDMLSLNRREIIDVDVERVKSTGSVLTLLDDFVGVDDCGNGYLELWQEYVEIVGIRAELETAVRILHYPEAA